MPSKFTVRRTYKYHDRKSTSGTTSGIQPETSRFLHEHEFGQVVQQPNRNCSHHACHENPQQNLKTCAPESSKSHEDFTRWSEYHIKRGTNNSLSNRAASFSIKLREIKRATTQCYYNFRRNPIIPHHLSYSGCPGFKSPTGFWLSRLICCGFPQSLQANAGIVP
jgi:hypothetical protein